MLNLAEWESPGPLAHARPGHMRLKAIVSVASKQKVKAWEHKLRGTYLFIINLVFLQVQFVYKYIVQLYSN